jgi:hypothetical protein
MTDYAATAGRSRITLHTISISCPVISTSLGPKRSAQLASDLQQSLTSNKLSPLGNWHFTPISSMPGYKTWHNAMAGQTLKYQL